MAMLDVKNISKSFGATRVLEDISFSLEQGETVAVIGASGSGKTTLLRCLTYLEKADKGTVAINGQTVFDAASQHKLTDSELRDRRLHFGMVFQSFNLFPQYTALENVMLAGQRLAKERPDYKSRKKEINQEVEDKAKELLAQVGLSDRMGNYPHQLSGGQQQRVAIARAVASSPKLLLLDEPLSNLDAKLRIDMRAELQRLHKELGTTIIYVTHDQTEALTMSTKIALFKAGELNQVATPTELYNNPIDLEAADFIGNPRINLLDGKAEVINGQLVVKSDLGGHTFPAEHLTSEEFPKSGEFDCVLAIRPEQIAISTQPVEGAIPVTIYANQPAGSETITTLKAGTDEFLAKDIGQIRYDLDQKVWAIIDQDKINIYNKETTRLIKRAV